MPNIQARQSECPCVNVFRQERERAGESVEATVLRPEGAGAPATLLRCSRYFTYLGRRSSYFTYYFKEEQLLYLLA